MFHHLSKRKAWRILLFHFHKNKTRSCDLILDHFCKTMAILYSSQTTAPRRAARKEQWNHLTLGLTIDRLSLFLCHTLPLHCESTEIRASAAVCYDFFLHRTVHEKIQDCCEQLSQTVDIVDAFLTNVSSDTPAMVVFEALTLRGLAQELLHKYELASESHLKAIWIASGTSQIPLEHRLTAIHHLALSCGAAGETDVATQMLKHLLSVYDHIHLSKNLLCVKEAESAIRRLQKKDRGKMRRSWFCTQSFPQ